MEKTKDIIDVLEKEDIQRKLILFNDDINSFAFIIISLIEICKFSSIQAENCTMIAHYKGKCCIKTGSVNELEPIHSAFSSRNVTTEIQ